MIIFIVELLVLIICAAVYAILKPIMYLACLILYLASPRPAKRS